MSALTRLPGARLLRREIRSRGLQANVAAAQLDLAPSTLSQILSGQIGVGLDTALRMHLWSAGRVPVLAWADPATRRAFRDQKLPEPAPLAA